MSSAASPRRCRCAARTATPARSRLYSLATLDAESHQLLGLRRWTVDPAQRFGTTRSGAPLVNVFIAADGSGALRRKRTGEALPLRPPAAACQAGAGHDRLSCASCHTVWAPRCASCHTSFIRPATASITWPTRREGHLD